jgi:hypothetical protein
MPRVSCTRCGAIFPIGNLNPRRVCAKVAKCDARIARKAARAVKIPPETPFTRKQLRKLLDSPFKGPNAPYPAEKMP